MSDRDKAKKEEIELNELLNISVSELIILQFLQRTRESMVRYELLEEINEILGSEKNISSSSFYLKLDKLESKGLISYVKGKGKKPLVKANENSTDVLNQINNLTFYAKLDTFQLMEEFAKDIQSRVGINTKGSLLVISFEEQLDRRKTNLLFSQVKEGYVLTDDESFHRFYGRSQVKNVKQTKIHEGKIREAEDFFDTCVLIGIGKNREFHGYKVGHWLNEAKRVLKPGGLIISMTISDIPQTGHIIADSLLEEIRKSELLNVISKAEFEEEMVKINLKELKIQEYKCVLVATGKK